MGAPIGVLYDPDNPSDASENSKGLLLAVVVADQVLGGIVGLITLMLVALGSVAAARYFGFLRA